MKINVTITGIVRKPSGESEITLNIEEGKEINKVLVEDIGYKEDELTYMFCFVNDKPVDIKTKLKENDNLLLTLIVGGG